MLLRRLLRHDPLLGVEGDATAFLNATAALAPDWNFKVEQRDLCGDQATICDFFPQLGLPDYSSFGGMFIRLWAVGSPARLLYGIYLGCKRAEQSEPRRGVAFARGVINDALRPLEDPGGRSFQYHAWTNATLNGWFTGTATTGSIRQATREFEPFITSKDIILTRGNVRAVVEDVRALFTAVAGAIALATPIREFGQGVLLAYYGENLPAAPTLPVTWPPMAVPGASPCGLIGLGEQYIQMQAALKAGKHIILLGPPGSGKTELAKCLCDRMAVPYDVATATSDWSTFDTIGGYLPDPSAAAITPGSADPLNFFPGIVLQALERRRWLIIDELNRADIDKAFGEMFTVLSGTIRSVRLPFKKRSFGGLRSIVLGEAPPGEAGVEAYAIPDTWRMIGTMNTFDKASLYQLSYAFMRRFAFIEVPLPPQADYEAELDRQAGTIWGVAAGDAYLAAALPLLKAVFSPPPGQGLDAPNLKLRVGLAIAVDVMKYLKTRRVAGTTAHASEDVLQALEMYLYPQFEGQNQKHLYVLSALRVIFSFDIQVEERTDRILATWTGFEGG